jgi:hypothetical protein
MRTISVKSVEMSFNQVPAIVSAFPKLGKPRCRYHSFPLPEVQPQYPIRDVLTANSRYHEFHIRYYRINTRETDEEVR